MCCLDTATWIRTSKSTISGLASLIYPGFSFQRNHSKASSIPPQSLGSLEQSRPFRKGSGVHIKSHPVLAHPHPPSCKCCPLGQHLCFTTTTLILIQYSTLSSNITLFLHTRRGRYRAWVSSFGTQNIDTYMRTSVPVRYS